jgi:3',5'-cyclic AMP phosphodiesterase CpdA
MTYNVTASSAATSVNAFKATIDSAKNKYSGQYDWLIVQHHTSTMTISAHACEKESEFFVNAGFEQMMTDKGVDLVLAGHDHIYTRSHLMKWDAGKGYSVKSADGKGTRYMTLTTIGGIKFYPPFSTSYANNGTETFPVLTDLTRGCTEMAAAYSIFSAAPAATIAAKTPLSIDFYFPKTFSDTYAPSYTICEVNGASMKLTTYLIDGKKVDEFTITPKGR